eukprot:TRINITY_DN1301_c0_g4_i3.p1 TRINITY_DN1301_c0_g4~~TRINITY_DN1301_c0_g4_i3.p1  ORF type:complete len:304 (-),score=71.01 TRINITY_DN1301_c0_g4_i3:58-969(-)
MFLRSVGNLFEVVLYTASTQDYANSIIDRIDPAHCIQHRLFRDHCTFYGSVPIKSLSQLGRNLKDVIIVDDMAVAYSKEPANGIPIAPWKGDSNDTQLEELLPVLEILAKAEDVRVYLKKVNRGGKVEFKKTLQVLKEEIAGKNGYPPTAAKNTTERAYKASGGFENNIYGLKGEGKYLLNSSKWRQNNSNMIAVHDNRELFKYKSNSNINTPLQKHEKVNIFVPIEYNSSRLEPKVRTDIREAYRSPAVPSRAHELINVASKNYSVASSWASGNLKNEKDVCRRGARAYGVYQKPKVTYANF